MLEVTNTSAVSFARFMPWSFCWTQFKDRQIRQCVCKSLYRYPEDDLRDLSGLPCLSRLYLQQPGGREACPVCYLSDYKSRVLCLLPHESSSKIATGSPGEVSCDSLKKHHANNSVTHRSSKDLPLDQRQVNAPSTELLFSRPPLMQPGDTHLPRPTRLRILDGIRIYLSDYREKTDTIQNYVRQQDEDDRRLRAAVAETCYFSAFSRQDTEDTSAEFPQYQENIVALRAALTKAKEALSAFQKLRQLVN